MKIIVLLFIPIFFLPTTIFSAPPVILQTDQNVYKLGRHIDLLEDTLGALSIQEVLSLTENFKPITAKILRLDQTQSAYWIQLKITHQIDRPREWYLELSHPTLNDVTLYIPSDNYISYSGRHLPFSQKEIADPNQVFRLNLSAYQTQILYIRIGTQSPKRSIQVPLILWTPSAYEKKAKQDNIEVGILFGGLAIMFFYTVFLYLSLRDFSYILYASFLASLSINQLASSGFGTQYLWTNSPSWAIYILLPSSFWILLSLVAFSQNFLNTKKNSPFLHFMFSSILIILAFSTCISMIPNSITQFRAPGWYILTRLIILITIALTIMSVICLKKNTDQHVFIR